MRIVEIHIEVNNIEKSLELYKKILPYKDIHHWKDKSAVALVFEDGSAFGIWEKGKLGIHNGQGGIHVHFAFQIESSELEYFRNSITNAGLEVLEHNWKDGKKSLYFFDYDNNQGEFMTGDWSS